MTKFLLPFMTVVIIFSACSKDSGSGNNSEKSVEKQVQFSIFAASDYSMSEYKDIQVSVTLTAGYVNKNTGVFTKQWDTVISKPLKEIPAIGQEIKISKTFILLHNLENLQLAHGILYNNSGQISQKGSFEEIPAELNQPIIRIGL